MKRLLKTIALTTVIIFILPLTAMALTSADNGIMKVYPTNGGLELDSEVKGFDIRGYVTDENTLISSTFNNKGYHTFLNVNGLYGEMNTPLTDSSNSALTWMDKAKLMQYTEVTGEGWQTISGIQLKVSTRFINNGHQLQIVYDLKNTTSSNAVISLATAADVQIDNDDFATIERLENGSGIRLWTDRGNTEKPVQFVFYGKDVPGTTAIDNLWIGKWREEGGIFGEYLKNIFIGNPDVNIIEKIDSAFTFSWVNRTINAGETQQYTVIIEVGEVNLPNTGLTLEDNTIFYYTDVIINGVVTDDDLKDTVTVHYIIDGGTEQTLPPITTNGTPKDISIDLNSLGLNAGLHTIKAWATDSTDIVSNVEENTFRVTYLKEPVVTLSTTEWAKNVNFRITDTVNEARWVDTYQYRFNDGTWVDCSKDTDIPVTENGNVKIDVRIKGTQEDDYSKIVTVYAKVDNRAPTTNKPSANTTTSTIKVNLGQTDSESGIDNTKTMYAIEIDGVWSDWQASDEFTGLIHNKEYKVKTKATDKAGNTSESEELTIKTDELKLGTLILKYKDANGNNYTEDTWSNQNIYVAVRENCRGGITKYKSKDGSVQTIVETNQETTIIKEGLTTITLYVTDGTNTITSDDEHIIKIDQTVPVINELSLDNDEWTKDSKNVTGKAIDSLSGIVAYLFTDKEDITNTSVTWSSISGTIEEITETKEISENGKLFFYVKDAAGNVAFANVDIKIDSQGPVINFSRGNYKTTINVTDTGSGIKDTKYAWTTDNIEPTDWTDYSSPVTYPGSSKDRIYLWAKATDKLDNFTISSTTFSAIKKPEIVSDNEFVDKYISFKITGDTEDEDVYYEFKINDGEWQSISKNGTHTITNIKEGNVKISARVLDNAGRVSDIATKTVKVSITREPIVQPENPTGVDDTTAKGKLPQTGNATLIKIITITLAMVSLMIILAKKIIQNRDIK